MLKPLTAITLAISFCRPTIPPADLAAYARIVDERSRAIDVDPILVVAIVDHESRWIPTSVNKKSGALGLGQILPQYRPACAKDGSSAVCKAEKKTLLDGAGNLRAMFEVIEAWQKDCKARVHTSGEHEWLTSYSGLNNPKAGEWCGWRRTASGLQRLPIHSVVRAFLARRRALRLRLEALPPG